jgi:hypothetical protein
LRSCQECRAYASGVEVFTHALRATALEAPAAPAFVPQRRRRRTGVVPAAAAAAIVVVVSGSSFAIGGMFGRQGSHLPSPTTIRGTSLAGPIDQLVLSAVRSQQSAPYRVNSRIIAL